MHVFHDKGAITVVSVYQRGHCYGHVVHVRQFVAIKRKRVEIQAIDIGILLTSMKTSDNHHT
jgi:hypothetical protein